jgi:hypothetical protein
LNVVEQAFALVVARFGLEIGSNLNWTELNTLNLHYTSGSTFTAESRSDIEPENPTIE